MNLKEFAKQMLVDVKKDQEWLTGQKEVLADIKSRMDECLKKAKKCDMTKGVYSTTQMAKELGMSSAQKLYEELKEIGVAFPRLRVDAHKSLLHLPAYRGNNSPLQG